VLIKLTNPDWISRGWFFRIGVYAKIKNGDVAGVSQLAALCFWNFDTFFLTIHIAENKFYVTDFAVITYLGRVEKLVSKSSGIFHLLVLQYNFSASAEFPECQAIH
jgi:hypothetical protein